MIEINKPEDTIPSMTITQAKLSIPAICGKTFEKYDYKRIGHKTIKQTHFDIYEIATEGEKYIYDNVDSFYGRGNLLPDINERDIPGPTKVYGLDMLMGSRHYEQLKAYGSKWNVDLQKIKVKFKKYSSEMVGNYIASYYPSRSEIDVTPIKAYDKEFGYPILHSYNLYRLFIMHQVIHILNGHNFEFTETEIKGNYYQPKPGVDCVNFKPLKKRTFSNEFINYTFWTHKPHAFDNSNEQFAFLNSARFGIQSNIFSEDEIKTSIVEACTDDSVKNNLFEILDWANKQKRP